MCSMTIKKNCKRYQLTSGTEIESGCTVQRRASDFDNWHFVYQAVKLAGASVEHFEEIVNRLFFVQRK